MINFLGLRNLLLNEGPWGGWSKDKRSSKNSKKLNKKTKAKSAKDNPTTSSGGSGGDSNNGPSGDNNDKKDKEKEVNQEESKEEVTQKTKEEEVVKEESKEDESGKEEISKEESKSDNTIIGPWGAAKGKKENSGRTNPEQKNKYENLIKDLVKSNSLVKNKNSGNGFGGGSGGGGSFGDSFFDKISQSPKKMLLTLLLGIISLWLVTGFYKVNSDENALVLYFGKYHTIATPGLNYHVPYPIGKVVKQSVTTVNSEEFGYSSRTNSTRRVARRGVTQPEVSNSENLMLTGDENIVDIEFQVQWQIKDIEKFTFTIAEPRLTIQKAAESAMREVIAVTPISEALSDGKYRIEQESRKLLQQILDDYGAGIRIVLLQLRRVDPPAQVIDSFRDVQTAKADKEREINEAQSYANDIIPRARGNAAEMQEKASAYKSRVIADSQGEANRFLALHGQYKRAKDVTRKRMYLETMQKIYGDLDKVIIDSNVSKGSLMPYFPLGDLNKGSVSAPKK